MNSLDRQFEELITERNEFEKEVIRLKAALVLRDKTIEVLHDKCRNLPVSNGD